MIRGGKYKFLFVSFLFILLVYEYFSRPIKSAHERQLANQNQTQQVARTVASPFIGGENRLNRENESKKEQEDEEQNEKRNWDGFLKNFGFDFTPEFSENHHLTAIRGSLGSNLPASTRDFTTTSPPQVAQRATDILDAVKNLVGINDRYPVQPTSIRTGPLTAQAFYQETYNSLPLANAGHLKVDLGPKGELLVLESDYIPSVEISNQRKIDTSTAKSKAFENLRRTQAHSDSIQNAVPTDSERPVIWMSGKNQGKIAYQFMIQGREIVIDAENGSVLFNRDRRQS